MTDEERLRAQYPDLLGADATRDRVRLVENLHALSTSVEVPAHLAASIGAAVGESRRRGVDGTPTGRDVFGLIRQGQGTARREWPSAVRGSASRAFGIAGLATFVVLVGAMLLWLSATLPGRHAGTTPGGQRGPVCATEVGGDRASGEIEARPASGEDTPVPFDYECYLGWRGTPAPVAPQPTVHPSRVRLARARRTVAPWQLGTATPRPRFNPAECSEDSSGGRYIGRGEAIIRAVATFGTLSPRNPSQPILGTSRAERMPYGKARSRLAAAGLGASTTKLAPDAPVWLVSMDVDMNTRRMGPVPVEWQWVWVLDAATGRVALSLHRPLADARQLISEEGRAEVRHECLESARRRPPTPTAVAPTQPPDDSEPCTPRPRYAPGSRPINVVWEFWPKTLAEARDRATLIVHARVSDFGARPDVGGAPTRTGRRFATLEILRILKGARGGAITVAYPFPEESYAEEDPPYAECEEYVLFLRPKEGERGVYKVISPLGRYRVVDDGKLQPMADESFARGLKGRSVEELERLLAEGQPSARGENNSNRCDDGSDGEVLTGVLGGVLIDPTGGIPDLRYADIWQEFEEDCTLSQVIVGTSIGARRQVIYVRRLANDEERTVLARNRYVAPTDTPELFIKGQEDGRIVLASEKAGLFEFDLRSRTLSRGG